MIILNSRYASWPGAMINIQGFELLSRINFYDPKGVRPIEVPLYLILVLLMQALYYIMMFSRLYKFCMEK